MSFSNSNSHLHSTAGSSHLQTAGSSHLHLTAGSSHLQTAGSSHLQTAGSSHLQTAGSSHLQTAGSSQLHTTAVKSQLHSDAEPMFQAVGSPGCQEIINSSPLLDLSPLEEDSLLFPEQDELQLEVTACPEGNDAYCSPLLPSCTPVSKKRKNSSSSGYCSDFSPRSDPLSNRDTPHHGLIKGQTILPASSDIGPFQSLSSPHSRLTMSNSYDENCSSVTSTVSVMGPSLNFPVTVAPVAPAKKEKKSLGCKVVGNDIYVKPDYFFYLLFSGDLRTMNVRLSASYKDADYVGIPLESCKDHSSRHRMKCNRCKHRDVKEGQSSFLCSELIIWTTGASTRDFTPLKANSNQPSTEPVRIRIKAICNNSCLVHEKRKHTILAVEMFNRITKEHDRKEFNLFCLASPGRAVAGLRRPPPISLKTKHFCEASEDWFGPHGDTSPRCGALKCERFIPDPISLPPMTLLHYEDLESTPCQSTVMQIEVDGANACERVLKALSKDGVKYRVLS